MLEFYTIFARNLPEFYITFSRRKIFIRIFFFGGGEGQPLARVWAPGPPPAKSGPVSVKFGTDVQRLRRMSHLNFGKVKVNVQGHLFRERLTLHGDEKT